MSKKEVTGSDRDSSTFLKMVVLVVLVVIAIGLMSTVFLMQSQQSRYDKSFFRTIGQQRELSLALVTDALEAARGGESAYTNLTGVRDQFDLLVDGQKAGNDTGGGGVQVINVRSPMVTLSLNQLAAQWVGVRGLVNTILEGRESLEAAAGLVGTIEESIPDIQILSDEIAVALIETGATENEVYIATRQLLLLQRMENNVSRLLGGGIETASAADRFGRDVALFARVLEAMRIGDPELGIARVADFSTRQLLDDSAELFATIETAAEQILIRSPELFQVVAASQEIISSVAGLRASIDTVSEQFANVSLPRERLAFMFGVLAALLLGGVAVWQIFEARARTREGEVRNRQIADQNARNQEAILTLLDEMGDLADGDLTVHANVTESLTGAIADSINYAVEALRDLVRTINHTSNEVAGASRETSSVAEQVENTSRAQTQQILSATESVDSMSQSMNDMSTSAGASAEVASSSVQLASQGGDRVRRTIQGMDVIREHIQETSKRIKRLGESSQEIGDIVGLINDIADQTNILALNAAIQAAAAGESGRGFAVVADEVQRLAERAGNSTKRIEQLVKTIQADTSEAVISMEKSTAEVVNGAELAERAGESLEEIENVSNKLADLINDMSHAAREQSEVAQVVSSTMESINELARQATEGTSVTARSVGRLTELSDDMRKSVAGFKLPSTDAASA